MKGVLGGLLVLALLCGCSPVSREPDNLALVRVLGVDGSGPVRLTAVCGAVGGRPPLRGACEGESFLRAREELPWTGEEELALTSVSWLVVGETAGLREVLFAVMEDRELGPSAAVWGADRDASALLADCEDPAAQLALLKERGVAAPSAAKVLGLLQMDGAVSLPVLTVREGRLEWKGEVRRHEQ